MLNDDDGEEQRQDVVSPVSHLTGSTFLSVQDSLENLKAEISDESDLTTARIRHFSDLLRLLRPILILNDAKALFVSLGGFEAIVTLLDRLDGAYNKYPKHDVLDVISAAFEVLSEALSSDTASARYAPRDALHDIWPKVEDALIATGCLAGDDAGHEATFGLLFALTLQEDSLKNIFRKLRREFDLVKPLHSTTSDAASSGVVDISAYADVVARNIGTSATVHFSEILQTIWRCWSISTSQNSSHTVGNAVLLTLAHLAEINRYNLLTLYDAGLVQCGIDHILRHSEDVTTKLCLEELLKPMLRLGIDDLDMVASIIDAAEDNHIARNILLQLINNSGQAPEINFNTSGTGYAAIEFADIGMKFPPSQHGYSVNAWVRVDEYDETCHATILGIFDPSQTCFFLLYLEAETHQLVLQTSTRSKNPSIRFKTFVFEQNRKYHVVVTHHRSSQLASLYVDGTLVEQQICLYPRQAPTQPQAFVGLPYDLAPRLGRDVTSSVWSLSALHLFSEVLTPELVLVYNKLGLGSYGGNFKDSLGSFLTYKHSTALTLIDERQEARSSSSLGQAIRSKRLSNDLILAVAPSLVFGHNTDKAHSVLRTQSAAQTVQKHLHDNRHGFTVNVAKIHLRDAIAGPESLGHLTQGVTFVHSHDITDSYWRLCGGLPLLLRHIAVARDVRSMLESISTMFTLLQRSWRLSETCERQGGFAMLMWLIRIKLGKQPLAPSDNIVCLSIRASEEDIVDLFKLVLEFVGVNVQRKQDVVLMNPLAYRTMVLDCCLWLELQGHNQRLFFDQLIMLLGTSHLRKFNTRRLVQLRISSKLLDSLENIHLQPAAEDSFQAAMLLIIRHTMTADVMRALALQITASLQNASTKDHGMRLLKALEAFLCDYGNEPVSKFSKTVSSKWMLHLLDSHDPDVVFSALRILTRVLIYSGSSYSTKFEEKTKGFEIMRTILARWWNEPLPYAACFAMMFGVDISSARSSELQLDTFYESMSRMNLQVENVAIWPILASMLEAAFKAPEPEKQATTLFISTLSFLETLLSRSQSFVDFVKTSTVARDLFSLLFQARSYSTPAAISPTRGFEDAQNFLVQPLLAAEEANDSYLTTKSYDQVIRFLVAAQAGEIISQREFAGLGLFFKAPEASLAELSHRATLVVRALLSRLTKLIAAQPTAYHDPQCLVNVARFASQTLEAVIEGWLDVGFNLLHFLATLLTYLGEGSVRGLKIIRLSSATIDSMSDIFRTLALVQLFQLDTLPAKSRSNFSIWLYRWKYIFLARGSADDLLLQPLFYLILQLVCSSPASEVPGEQRARAGDDADNVKLNLVKLMEIYVRCEPTKSWQALSAPSTDDHTGQELFARLNDTKLDSNTYIMDNIAGLSKLKDTLQPSFRNFITTLSKAALMSAEARCKKREERLHLRHLEELSAQHAVMEHQARSQPWHENIKSSELMRQSRVRQDRQDNDVFQEARFAALGQVLSRLNTSKTSSAPVHWIVDNAEGRDRKKVRLRQHKSPVKYLSRRDKMTSNQPMKSVEQVPSGQAKYPPPKSLGNQGTESSSRKHENDVDSMSAGLPPQDDGSASLDDFEIIEQSTERDEDMIDINRKVMRSLRRGEQILEVYNVTRIKGLEAVISILIVGKKCLYLLDNLFYRANGEVVNPEQVPDEERDQYIVDILGGSSNAVTTATRGVVKVDSVHSWLWSEILNVSKRRFLLRDVGLELFFRDGRSYLITTPGPSHREPLYTSITKRIEGLEKATLIDKLRVEQLVTPENTSSRFFSLGAESSVTTRWLRGEMSNFHYLMLVNTMAGRTTTDLTQYPVFPWVLKDYSSEELALDDPNVYRDLSKPMGAQDADREAAYNERYRAFAEMSDPDTPPFHYGTHYSSAMIVSSYLLRLEPFTAAHCLLQGGSFDLPERLFDSIGKTWFSAARDTVTDVRELTPEFYYLPDFLRNINGYDFGTKESNGEVVHDVKLPPWAKDDPQIFIAKHREALESRYVTENLHKWIDLVFGYKQRGDAAIEATNVFHHLSYHGVNLDQISDERERLAAVGVIHNFGQTPRQVFFKPHDQRLLHEGQKTTFDVLSDLSMSKELIIKAENQIANIILASKAVIQAGPYRSYRPPSFSTYVEWGNTDGSLRFYRSDSGKLLDLFEALHTDHISMATWVDHRTLLTASLDSTVCIWSIDDNPSGLVDLELKSGLFGHRQPVNLIVASNTLSTLLTCASEEVFLWDLNTYERLRTIDVDVKVEHAQINHSNGHILLCSDKSAWVVTINGQLLVRQDVCDGALDDSIQSCTFYESTKSEWIGGEYILTGHTKGVAKIWRLINTQHGSWRLDLVKQLNHAEAPRPSSSRSGKFSRSGKDALGVKASRPPDVTCVYAVDKKVYTGDEAGYVYEWTSK